MGIIYFVSTPHYYVTEQYSHTAKGADLTMALVKLLLFVLQYHLPGLVPQKVRGETEMK